MGIGITPDQCLDQHPGSSGASFELRVFAQLGNIFVFGTLTIFPGRYFAVALALLETDEGFGDVDALAIMRAGNMSLAICAAIPSSVSSPSTPLDVSKAPPTGTEEKNEQHRRNRLQTQKAADGLRQPPCVNEV
jgi:hypothetical protein